MALTGRAQMDVAVGTMTLHGDGTDTAFSLGLPMRYWPHRRLGVEVRPVWGFFGGGTVTDVDVGLLYRYEHISLRAGYRWMESRGESLGGPRIGFSLRF